MSPGVKAAIVGAVFLVGAVAGGLIAGNGGSNTADAAPSGNTTSPTVSAGERAQDAEASPDPVDVAIEYATASQAWLYLTDEQIDAAIQEIAVSEVADRLSEETIAEVGVAREALTHSAGPIWWFVRPLAVKAEVGESRADVSVWVVTVLSAADVAVPQADWVTLDLDLVRVGDDWLLESIVDTVGPTPMSGVRDEPWQPEPFDDALAGFERIGPKP